MVLLALRAGEHRVIVRHEDALRPGFLEQVAVDASDPRDHSVRRRVLDQVFDRTPSPLRRDHQRTVLDERARVAQVVDIFASGALSGLAPARDCLGPCRVESERMTLDHFRKGGPHTIEVHVAGLGAMRRLDIGLLDEGQRMPFEDCVALGNRDAPHDSALVGRDDVLHFHRFHDEQLLAAMHAVAFAHVDGNDRALHRRLDRNCVLGCGDVVRPGSHNCRGRRNRRWRVGPGFPVMEHGQRIARVDLCSCAPSADTLNDGSGSCRWTIEEQSPMFGIFSDQRSDMVLDEARVDAVRDEIRMPQQALQETNIGRHALDSEFT